MEFFTAGESHGKGIITLINGFPRGIVVNEELIKSYLTRRQKIGGRGARAWKEEIKFDILSGVYKGKTTGAPICIFIPNTNDTLEKIGEINCPRPGHIDLPAALKYLEDNSREFLERASARETAGKVVAGAFATMILNEFNINVLGYTKAIGPFEIENIPTNFTQLQENVLSSSFALPDKTKDKEAEKILEEIKDKGDTIGGVVEVIAKNIIVGLGDHNLWYKRLDAKLAHYLMALQGVKGIEIGNAIYSSRTHGSNVYGDIQYDISKPFLFTHTKDNMGGIEGGITTGEDIKIKLYIKPIPTMLNRKQSVDLKTLSPSLAHYESSDYCNVPALTVIAQAVVCFVLADALLDNFSSIDIKFIKQNFNTFVNKFKNKFSKKN